MTRIEDILPPSDPENDRRVFESHELRISASALGYVCLQWPAISKRFGVVAPERGLHRLNLSDDDVAKDVATTFWSYILEDYEIIARYLPRSAKTVLDIGCGCAGIDAAIHVKGWNKNLKYFLIDKSQVSDKFTYGFSRRKRFYASLEVAREVLTCNGVEPSNIRLIDATSELPDISPVDVLLSMHSWGFHYPIEEYLIYACMMLDANGVAIIDVRESKNDLTPLQACFGRVERIQEHGLRTRVLLAEPKPLRAVDFIVRNLRDANARQSEQITALEDELQGRSRQGQTAETDGAASAPSELKPIMQIGRWLRLRLARLWR